MLQPECYNQIGPRVQIVHVIINIVVIRAFVSRAIQCFLGYACQVAGNSRKTNDVIPIRFLLSEAFLFNPCTPPKFTRLSKEILIFYGTRRRRKGENLNPCGLIIFQTADRSKTFLKIFLYEEIYRILVQDFRVALLSIVSEFVKVRSSLRNIVHN